VFDPLAEPRFIPLAVCLAILGLKRGTHIGQQQSENQSGVPQFVKKAVFDFARQSFHHIRTTNRTLHPDGDDVFCQQIAGDKFQTRFRFCRTGARKPWSSLCM
jgi:hypothetical protein